MSLKVTNKTNESLQEVHELVNKFFPYAQKRLGFNRPVALSFVSDSDNASNPLGKTAYYDPNANEISIYIDKRHPKDILRSFSHELVHHNQNCRGEFEGDHVTEEGYAQKDEHLRMMEKEAYLEGNLLIRDWEDGIKSKSRKKTMNEQTLRKAIREALKAKLMEGSASGLTVHTHKPTQCDEVHSGQSHEEWAQETRLAESEELEERRRRNTEDRRGTENYKPADRVQPLEEEEDVSEGEEVVEEEEELEERRGADSPDRRGANLPEDRKKPLEEAEELEEAAGADCEELKDNFAAAMDTMGPNHPGTEAARQAVRDSGCGSGTYVKATSPGAKSEVGSYHGATMEENKSFEQLKEERLYDALMKKWIK